mmetsp:Transcript_64977/g.198696  ORF Transcript_64977/g.198696 Transcript_64977/m.198696 type:complete len:239 (-) Transcript_64977:165-881(-)
MEENEHHGVAGIELATIERRRHHAFGVHVDCGHQGLRDAHGAVVLHHRKIFPAEPGDNGAAGLVLIHALILHDFHALEEQAADDTAGVARPPHRAADPVQPLPQQQDGEARQRQSGRTGRHDEVGPQEVDPRDVQVVHVEVLGLAFAQPLKGLALRLGRAQTRPRLAGSGLGCKANWHWVCDPAGCRRINGRHLLPADGGTPQVRRATRVRAVHPGEADVVVPQGPDGPHVDASAQHE